jgi:HD-GYP domain-containing protein (c-di-GMP phosphodiesterase class II)
MDQLIRAIAAALDIVEGELLGASTNHGKRIAVLSAAMGRYCGMDTALVSALSTCALLHDSALTEYIMAERLGSDAVLSLHCQAGQRNVEALLGGNPLQAIDGFVLYHHERADGFGPFGKPEGAFPLGAAIIAIADTLDVTYHLQRISALEVSDLRTKIAIEAGTLFTRDATQAMLGIFDEAMLRSLGDDRILETAQSTIPVWTVDITNTAVFHLADLIARIIDYKSTFTRRHSVEIANRAWLMSGYYGYDLSLRARLYLAAALHDLGKLAIPSQILEKPGKLDDAEFACIKSHVPHTWELLKDITGFGDICTLASSHHEKLDGTGYPWGKKAEDLDFNARMLACIDIYQAVSEARPYHSSRSHAETMPVLYDMAQKGLIDKTIVGDLDTVMAPYSNQAVPSPTPD